MHEGLPDDAMRQVLILIRAMADMEWTTVERHCRRRLRASDVERTIAEYGRTLVPPPMDADGLMDVVPVGTGNAWHVMTPLWTAEEGRSDLSARLTVVCGSDGTHVELDDVLVP